VYTEQKPEKEVFESGEKKTVKSNAVKRSNK
jgi:hypothetical protein